MKEQNILPVVIIGAGLSGLLTGYRLKKAGVAVKILEARERAGGRIFTVQENYDTPLEMGATWFGNQHQNFKDVLEELKIPVFEQFMEGSALFEATPFSPSQRISIPMQDPSFRIVGGTAKLIQILQDSFTAEEVLCNEQVKQVSVGNEQVNIKTHNNSFSAQKVICCLPPALLVNSIKFLPELPEQLSEEAKKTHTWMQESIKAGVVYNKAFWRKEKVSTIISNHGPVIEFYDHSDSEDTRFALCGFLHPNYAGHTRKKRKEKVIQQLKRMFGEQAGEYVAYEEVVWQNEKYTNAKTGEAFLPHQNNGSSIFQQPLFKNKVWVSNSETSAIYGGYMEGAVHSANQVAKRILEEQQ